MVHVEEGGGADVLGMSGSGCEMDAAGGLDGAGDGADAGGEGVELDAEGL